LTASVAALATLGMVVGTAFGAQYEETGTLSHGGCAGYGWGNSAHSFGVYSGTILTGGSESCYRKQNAYYEYNTVDVFNPDDTGWQTYNLFQGAGPQGSCDVEVTTHWISSNQVGSASGFTSADDGC
jgi:hypothetical protein